MISTLLEAYIASQLTSITNPTPANWDSTTILDANAIPTHDGIHIAPIIEADSALIIDLETGLILYEKNAYDRASIASITKLMTTTIILEENDLEEVVTVSKNAAETTGSRVWLYENEQIRVKDLLYAAIIHSGNDAAVALAEHNAGSVEEFVKKMNKKADSLGLYNTSFSNPIGFDEENNFSTAYDVSLLGRYAFKKDFIRHAASIESMEISSINGSIKHDLKSTNELLKSSFFNIKGLKTGRTDEAGLCLVGIAENQKQNQIITVVLNSPDRFKETKILIDWAYRAYKW